MKYTFGKNQAAIKLETLLQYDPLARRKIASLLSDYTNQLLSLTQAKDPRTVRTCMALLRDYNLRRIDDKKGLTKDIKSYSKNIVTGRYRAYKTGFEVVLGMMNKLKS